jgi:hypothetical protein
MKHSLWTIATLLALCGCTETATQKEQRAWLDVVNAATNEGNIGLQLGYCKNPPTNAPNHGLQRCADVDGPAAMEIARPGVEKVKHGPNTYCDWMLDALKVARPDTPNWNSTKTWTGERCCVGPVDNERAKCEAVGIAYRN